MPDDAPIPLALSDAQFAQIIAGAQPLPAADRDQYLRRCAALLNECAVIGDGVVGRIAAQAQRELFTAPRSGNATRQLRAR